MMKISTDHFYKADFTYKFNINLDLLNLDLKLRTNLTQKDLTIKTYRPVIFNKIYCSLQRK